MLSALPETRVVLTVLAPEVPWTTDRLVGLAAIEKLLDVVAAVTVRLTPVAWVAEAAVPVTVRL